MVHEGSLESPKEAKELLEEIAEGKSSFLSALQTFQVHHNSMEHSLKHEPIVFITLPMEMDIKTRARLNQLTRTQRK